MSMGKVDVGDVWAWIVRPVDSNRPERRVHASDARLAAHAWADVALGANGDHDVVTVDLAPESVPGKLVVTRTVLGSRTHGPFRVERLSPAACYAGREGDLGAAPRWRVAAGAGAGR